MNMPAIARILVGSRKSLLGASDLPSLCAIAKRYRAYFAGICVTAFCVALAVVVGYRSLPFEWVPAIIGVSFCVFVISAATASRLGRLTDARLNVEYAKRIGHLTDINPACADYERAVKAQNRPFTRLDLDELGAIHLRNSQRK